MKSQHVNSDVFASYLYIQGNIEDIEEVLVSAPISRGDPELPTCQCLPCDQAGTGPSKGLSHTEGLQKCLRVPEQCWKPAPKPLPALAPFTALHRGRGMVPHVGGGSL